MIPAVLRPPVVLTKHPKQALTFWTILHDVSAALERIGRTDAAQMFRREARELQDGEAHEDDQLQDLLELACGYADIS